MSTEVGGAPEYHQVWPKLNYSTNFYNPKFRCSQYHCINSISSCRFFKKLTTFGTCFFPKKDHFLNLSSEVMLKHDQIEKNK